MAEPFLSTPVRKVSIINTYATNGGDAAILFGVIDQVQRQFGADVQIVIYEQQRDLAARYLPGLDFRSVFYFLIKDQGSKYWVRLLRVILMLRFMVAAWAFRFNCVGLARLFLSRKEFEDLEAYATSDAIVTTGGTYLVENYLLLPLLFGLEIARILRKPLIFYTQSLGPFHNSFNRHVLRKLFNFAHLVLLRDSRSLANIEELQVKNDNLIVTSDVVFCFAEKEVLRAAADHPPVPKNGSLQVGFTVRNWAYFKGRTREEGMDSYLRSVGAMITRLVREHGARIVFVSTCQGVMEQDDYESDAKVALKIKAMLPQEVAAAVEVNEKFHRYEELMAIYRTCDFIVSTRLHGAILALSSGTPVLPIAYEFKTTEMFTSFGLGDWILEIETIEPEKAVWMLDRYLAELPTFRRTLFERVEQSRQDVEKSAGLMRKAVLQQIQEAQN
jgi:colanic acid/amylovoran biosynthesis protein